MSAYEKFLAEIRTIQASLDRRLVFLPIDPKLSGYQAFDVGGEEMLPAIRSIGTIARLVRVADGALALKVFIESVYRFLRNAAVQAESGLD